MILAKEKILINFSKVSIKTIFINVVILIKSWSTGFETNPYGLVINTVLLKNILVFNNRNIIGTLWPNIGEISLDRGVRKYQIWKKVKNEEFVMLN